MARLTSTRPRIAATVLLLALVSGCFQAKTTTELAYDEDRDAFRLLRLYTHIAPKSDDTDQERDNLYAYLKALWINRRDIIMVPDDLFDLFDLFGRSEQILYVDDHYFKWLSFGEQRGEPTTQSTPVALSEIVIRPGHFFRSSHKTLCYYHQNEFPGELVDRVLIQKRNSVSESLFDTLSEERQARQKGGKQPTWDETRQYFDAWAIDSLGDPTEGAQPAAKPEEETTLPEAALQREEQKETKLPFDDESLRLLLSAAAGRHIDVRREKENIEIRLPLSLEDARQVVATKQYFHTVVLKALPQTMTEEDRTGFSNLSLILEQLDISVNTTAGGSVGGLVIRLNLVGFLNLLSDPSAISEKLSESDVETWIHPVALQAISEAEKRGIPISSERVDIGKLIAAFRAGDLGKNFPPR